MEKPEEMVIGKYAKLTLDFTFKKAFASEEDKDLLIALLNAFLERKLAYPITDVLIKNPYIQGQTIDSRGSILDIRCQDAANNSFIVEMQMSKQAYFFKRSLLYSSQSIVSSAKKGEGYDFNYPNVYSLNFLDFDVDIGDNRSNVVQYVSFSDEDCPATRYEYVNLVFVRLPRFRKSIEECESLQDKLLFSLRHAHELDSPPEQLNGNLFDRLFMVAKISNFTDMELSQYVSRAMFRADRKGEIDTARDEGIAIGKNEGIVIGRQEGEARLLQAARQMKAKSFGVSVISEITGLPKEDVERL